MFKFLQGILSPIDPKTSAPKIPKDFDARVGCRRSPGPNIGFAQPHFRFRVYNKRRTNADGSITMVPYFRIVVGNPQAALSQEFRNPLAIYEGPDADEVWQRFISAAPTLMPYFFITLPRSFSYPQATARLPKFICNEVEFALLPRRILIPRGSEPNTFDPHDFFLLSPGFEAYIGVADTFDAVWKIAHDYVFAALNIRVCMPKLDVELHAPA